MQNESYYTLGLDLGKTRDPTALAVIETHPSTSNLQLRDLYRFDLGTPYSDVLRRLGHRLTNPPFLGRARLAVDASASAHPSSTSSANNSLPSTCTRSRSRPAAQLTATTGTPAYPRTN
jgi:hypothetical protein